MRSLLYILAAVVLCSCTTPTTTLRNNDTGQIATCGGNTSSSIMLGAIGYYSQKSSDSDCVVNYVSNGFKVVKSDK